MAKEELREMLETSNKVCEDYDLYDLLECETENDFENELISAIECISIDAFYLKRLADKLENLTYDEMKGDNE